MLSAGFLFMTRRELLALDRALLFDSRKCVSSISAVGVLRPAVNMELAANRSGQREVVPDLGEKYPRNKRYVALTIHANQRNVAAEISPSTVGAVFSFTDC